MVVVALFLVISITNYIAYPEMSDISSYGGLSPMTPFLTQCGVDSIWGTFLMGDFPPSPPLWGTFLHALQVVTIMIYIMQQSPENIC